jgi:hypothetical protein
MSAKVGNTTESNVLEENSSQITQVMQQVKQTLF